MPRSQGFGQTGPNTARPAYDIIVQAMSGLMTQTGGARRAADDGGQAVADVAGGLFAAWGSWRPLRRERTGRRGVVDVALDALVAMMPTAAARVLVCDQDPARTGNRHALSAPFGVYRRHRAFRLAVLNDRLFAEFLLCNR